MKKFVPSIFFVSTFWSCNLVIRTYCSICLPEGLPSSRSLQPSKSSVFFYFFRFISHFSFLPSNFDTPSLLYPDLQYCLNIHSHLSVKCMRYFCGRFSPGSTVFAPTQSCLCPTPRYICVSSSALADTFWTARMTHRALQLCEQRHSSGHFLNCQNDSQSPASVWAAAL